MDDTLRSKVRVASAFRDATEESRAYAVYCRSRLVVECHGVVLYEDQYDALCAVVEPSNKTIEQLFDSKKVKIGSGEVLTLNLKGTELEELSDHIAQLTKLTHLHLFNNQLQTLPENIGQLTKLTRLDLDNNQLQTLPERIGQLTKLTHLYLAYNQLQTLPESIGQLIKLTHLYLGNNQLQNIPESIGQLTKLQTLNIWDNQLQDCESVLDALREKGVRVYV